jgi:hypothetical protein
MSVLCPELLWFYVCIFGMLLSLRYGWSFLPGKASGWTYSRADASFMLTLICDTLCDAKESLAWYHFQMSQHSFHSMRTPAPTPTNETFFRTLSWCWQESRVRRLLVARCETNLESYICSTYCSGVFHFTIRDMRHFLQNGTHWHCSLWQMCACLRNIPLDESCLLWVSDIQFYLILGSWFCYQVT